MTGNIIFGNAILSEIYDVAIRNPALVQVQFNNLLGLQYGLDNLGAGGVDASDNWWSCPAGPSIPGSCSMASGSNVLDAAFLSQAFAGQLNF